MNVGDFRDLAVYQRYATLSDAVHELAARMAKFERWTIGIQLVRAVDSIGANIAEAYGRGSDLDRRRFLLMARGSINKAEHWLDRAAARGLCDPSLKGDIREVGRMLNGLLKTFRPT